jgi:GGDEF domain-containing protein
MDLDGCLQEAKEFEKTSAARGAAAQHQLFIGISARNGRLVSANRLLSEAEKALSRAGSAGGGSIIAFRADPDKYRAALAARSTRRRR